MSTKEGPVFTFSLPGGGGSPPRQLRHWLRVLRKIKAFALYKVVLCSPPTGTKLLTLMLRCCVRLSKLCDLIFPFCLLETNLPWFWLNISVVPNVFVTADRSPLDNFTVAREYYVMVVIFQQLKSSYQFHRSGKAAACWRAAETHRLCSPPILLLETTALTHAQKASGVTTRIHIVISRPRDHWTRWTPLSPILCGTVTIFVYTDKFFYSHW